MPENLNATFGRRTTAAAPALPQYIEKFTARRYISTTTSLSTEDLLTENSLLKNDDLSSLVSQCNSLKVNPHTISPALVETKNKIYNVMLSLIDLKQLSTTSDAEVESRISDLVHEIIAGEKLILTHAEEKHICAFIIDDMLGYGPLQPLLRDETVTDIMVNSPNQVFAERSGKLVLTDVKFRDNDHVTQIGRRIVSLAGRRFDESNPMCDARLADGSRVHVAMPPSVLKGTTICIRKFSKNKITLDDMVSRGNISQEMSSLLKICAASRLNILISGGTGSGKTTLLGAISKSISEEERVITIEDTAELQLQQQHVVTMETRNSNVEGDGEISMGDLLKNSLRMRPDRIILGEVRGPEAYDLLQAMNTGHDGSMGTLHANSPKDALTRLENMISMANPNLTTKAIQTQIANSINLIVHVARMRDGKRRITHITEVTGMEGDVIFTNEIFKFEYSHENQSGEIQGEFVSRSGMPNFAQKASYYNLKNELIELFKKVDNKRQHLMDLQSY